MSFRITEFELEEQVFVPAGDGEPAQWKTKGDLNLAEAQRHSHWACAQADLHLERLRRYYALIDGAKAVGLPSAPISLLLDEEEMAELTALKLTLDVQEREHDRRPALIDRDIAAGKFITIPPHS